MNQNSIQIDKSMNCRYCLFRKNSSNFITVRASFGIKPLLVNRNTPNEPNNPIKHTYLQTPIISPYLIVEFIRFLYVR